MHKDIAYESLCILCYQRIEKTNSSKGCHSLAMTEGSVGTWKDILSEQSYRCSLMRFMEAGILYNSSIISSPNTKVSLFPYFMNVIAMLLLTSQSHGRLVKAQATEPLPVFLIQRDQHPSYFPKSP